MIGRLDTAAIIVAGGRGLRYGGTVRKQYLLLNRKPLVWWSLSAFDQSPSVGSMTLVVPLDDLEKLRVQSRGWNFKKRLTLVEGGATRAESVRRGLAVVAKEMRYVAVHDAVRPLITPNIIEDVIRAARKSNAALAAYPSKDTVKLANGGNFVLSSPPREAVWLAQTPQIFGRRLLERAHERIVARGQTGHEITDDAQLVERLGVRVKLVKSSPENLKVTVPMDFVLARQILEDRH